jgi:tight adherence protein C
MMIRGLFLIAGLMIAASAIAFVIGLFSAAGAPRPLFGHAARRRAEALRKSWILRVSLPLIELFASLDTLLDLKSYRAWLARSLVHAGQPAGLRPEEFVGVSVLAGFGGLSFGIYVSLMTAGKPVFGFLMLGAIIGAALPNFWLSQEVDRRLKDVNRGLPYAINMIVLAMDAGLDFTSAVKRYVMLGERREDIMREELEMVLAELDLGRTRREALEAMAERLPSETVRGVVVAAVQADRLGTPLAKTLREQMHVVQTRRTQTAEKKAAESSVKILGPLLFIFAAVFLVLFSSIILRACSGGLL